MNTKKVSSCLCFALLMSQFCAAAQSAYLFRLTFRGTAYQTNTTGTVVATPITDRTLLQDAATAGGITDISSLALVYHIQGSSFGDTIDVVNVNSRAVLTTLYGLFFGDDTVQTLGRTALTNNSGTIVRRLDYIYTSQNSHSMGASFTTKRFLTDAKGNVHTTIDGQVQWLVNPVGNAGAKLCIGTFTTTRPF